MAKEKVKIHIIHSMKGGCGKSTCALSKALQLSSEGELDKNGGAKVLFVDVDFRGSALQWLLFREHAEKKMELLKNVGNVEKGKGLTHCFALPDNYARNKNLSQYLLGNVSTVCDIIYRTFTYEVENELETSSVMGGESTVKEDNNKNIFINGYIDMVLSASEVEAKTAFRHNFETGVYRMPALTAGIFRYRITDFLKKILCVGQVKDGENGKYSHIVIDMPPSYDEYSDIFLMELRKLAHENRDVELNYYAVTTDDVGHLHLTLNNVRNELKGNPRYKVFNTVNVILNSVMQEDFKDWQTKKEVNNLWEVLGKGGKLYRKEHESAYHKFCQDISCQEFPLKPIEEVYKKKENGEFYII